MVLSNVNDTFIKYTEGTNLPVTRKHVSDECTSTQSQVNTLSV
jgi:hypothetical protein